MKQTWFDPKLTAGSLGNMVWSAIWIAFCAIKLYYKMDTAAQLQQMQIAQIQQKIDSNSQQIHENATRILALELLLARSAGNRP